MANPTPIALPGQTLSPSTTTDLGPGTHIDSATNTLRASIAGPILTSQTKKQQTISIPRATPLLPEVGSTHLCGITRLTKLQAHVSILSPNTTTSFPGLIRQQDIRLTQSETTSVSSAFRVGDIVRATVISLGDERAYYLSTARNDLGVVMATSEQGNVMFPISWKEFQDEVTGAKEERKVAKPV